MDRKLRDCVLNLYNIGSVRFGTFKLKSGLLSPLYIDLRPIVSYPELLRQIADLIWQCVAPFSFERICAVPYAALPLATALCLQHNLPMLFRRKEIKSYGTKKSIEGCFEKGQRCLIIDDLITSGSSLFETIESLEKEGLEVNDLVVFLDREQGGGQRIKDRGYTLHSVLTISTLLSVLQEAEKISTKKVKEIHDFLGENQVI